jgi:hypothetical protein
VWAVWISLGSLRGGFGGAPGGGPADCGRTSLGLRAEYAVHEQLDDPGGQAA